MAPESLAPETAAELDALKDCAEALEQARIVGHWIWVEFGSKPADSTREFLKARGYHWNKTRGCWQHACGYKTRPARGYDPRWKYGELKASALLEQEA